jgi:hypothetical protein
MCGIESRRDFAVKLSRLREGGPGGGRPLTGARECLVVEATHLVSGQKVVCGEQGSRWHSSEGAMNRLWLSSRLCAHSSLSGVASLSLTSSQQNTAVGGDVDGAGDVRVTDKPGPCLLHAHMHGRC